MNRRTYLKTVGAGIASSAIAGCITGGGEVSGTLTVATYESFIGESEDPAGVWLEEAFTAAYPDVTIEWDTREQGLNYYIQRAQEGVDVDADVYVGLNVDDLVRVDDNLDDPLFSPLDRGAIERADRVRDDLAFDDPEDRILPYDTGFISLVYDENEVDEPAGFDDLLDPAYEGTLLAQDARFSDPGQAFVLWTIDRYGEEGYLEYWRDLLDNDVRILGSWWDAYSAYLEEERPIVVSYSTDQVFSVDEGYDLSRHQIGFLENQGFANPEGMAIFEDAGDVDLANTFLDFVLSSEAQAEIAVRNVQFPAVEDEFVELDEEFTQYAHEPEEAVTFTYDELRGNLDGWTEDWAREIAGQ